MPDFIPANSIELELRNLLRDRNTPSWNFYTPLAAASLWVIAKNHPELDGSEHFAPPGENPHVLTFKGPDGSWLGLYTAPERTKDVFTRWKLPEHDYQVIPAPGYQLLRYAVALEAQVCINLGCPECQYTPDPDMIQILLDRGEPAYETREKAEADFAPAGNPEQYLAPLRDFLSQQSGVRAAWVLRRVDPDDPAATKEPYEIELLLRDPDDRSLLGKVTTMAKALTPVEMEWIAGTMMADDQSLRHLARRHSPFYTSPEFQRFLDQEQ